MKWFQRVSKPSQEAVSAREEAEEARKQAEVRSKEFSSIAKRLRAHRLASDFDKLIWMDPQ